MTGFLQQKNGKYYIVLNTYIDGVRKPKWISTGIDVRNGKRKAELLLEKTLAEYNEAEERGIPYESNMYLHEYIIIWLQRAKQRVCITTYEGYEIVVRRYLIPYFKDHPVKIKDVNRRVLQNFFDYLSVNGRKDGKGPLSPKSLRHIKNPLHLTLREAVRDELISSNPCDLVELPKLQQYDAHYYNAKQIRTLFSAIEGDILEPMIKITALYGLRRSETLGIKWDSIDRETKRLIIKHTVVTVSTTIEKDTTKNKSSRRIFLLTDEVIRILAKLKEQEEENRILFGAEYQENDYVFKWPNGKPFSTGFVNRHFNLILKKHGLPHIRFHELRHSCASMLLNDGYTLKDVQEYMGHADIQMTADLYGHLDMARKDMLSNHLANRIFSDPDAKVIELGIAAIPWNNCVSSHGDAKMIEKNVKIAQNGSKR